jgi:hypothetical protein
MVMNIRRAAAAAAVIAVVALSGCASVESGYWAPRPQQPKLPGDSLGYQSEQAAIDVA